MTNSYDYIIVGSGIAGLYTALLARKYGSVLLVTKGLIDDCNTKHAQGGIAAAIGQDDSGELHFQDTMANGCGLSDPNVVRILVDEAADRIADLVNLGVPFDTVEGEIALTLEAAHSRPRILHAGGDATGAHIEDTLSHRLRLTGIKLLEDCLATEIVVEGGVARGVKTLDCHSGRKTNYQCRYLILATGGAGQIYKFTTNSKVATGDGIALAYAAGAEIVDMEFFQFHPTALWLPGVNPFLISEAVRGEGGRLVNEEGYRFMPDYSSQAELAPRDVVARSILSEMTKAGKNSVYLDVTHLEPRFVASRFPQIYRFCLDHGLDITRERVPVAPAAHYMIGGVRVNSWGETNIAGLFAVGETAATGVHGANRLASNSLLEVLVFGKRIVERTTGLKKPLAIQDNHLPAVRVSLPYREGATEETPSVKAVQNLLWERASVVRDEAGLTGAVNTLAAWQKVLPPPKGRSSYELGNLIMASRLVTEAALLRQESRGAHFRSDFAQNLPKWQKHIIFKSNKGGNHDI